jgi:hypothetical protein
MSKIFKVPGIRYFYRRYIQNREQYLKENREEVLFLYRKLLRMVPETIDRKLLQQAKIEVPFP